MQSLVGNRLDIFNDFPFCLATNSDESPHTREVAIKDLSEYRRLSNKYIVPLENVRLLAQARAQYFHE
jgi:hypothetical protein